MTSYEDWADQHLTADAMGAADPDLCRMSYSMYCSDRAIRPEGRSKQRGVAVRAGGRPVGRGEHLRYVGLRLAPLDPSMKLPAAVVGAALAALRDGGLISNDAAMVAAIQLTKEQR